MQRKREGAEKMALAATELSEHEKHLDRLEAELERAHAESQVPETATTAAALDDFVVRLRLERC